MRQKRNAEAGAGGASLPSLFLPDGLFPRLRHFLFQFMSLARSLARSLGRENNEAVDADDGHRKHQKASNKRRVVEPSDPEFQDPGGVNP